MFNRIPGDNGEGRVSAHRNGGARKSTWDELYENNLVDKKLKVEDDSGDIYVDTRFSCSADCLYPPKWFFTLAVPSPSGAIYANFLVMVGCGDDFSCGVFTEREAKSIDEKVDDGFACTGNMIGNNLGRLKEYDINNKKEATRSLLFKLDF